MHDQAQGAAPDPEQFGRYRVKKILGRGAMGVVYLAEDPRIGRDVAIKVIRFNPDAPPALQMHLRRRFEVEALSAGGLSHPNIVTIYDIGEQQDVSYIAMEFVHGESLESVLQSERIEPTRVVDLVEQLCRALDFAHERGVVHRDIKPANILITSDGRPKIVDFGVAKLNATMETEDTRLTQVGSVIGTPAYMSPEQVNGQEATARSDQFSLAVVAYEMLAGAVPFQGALATAVMYQIVHEDPPGLQSLAAHLPAGLDAVLRRALAKEPEHRYPRCQDFARELRNAFSETVLLRSPAGSETAATSAAPSPQRRRSLTGLVAGVAVIAAAATGFWLLRPSATSAPVGVPEPPAPVLQDQAAVVDGPPDDAIGAEATRLEPEAAVAPTARPIRITSRPAGATVVLDDATLDARTPVDVQLEAGRRYQMRIELDGFRTASWAFTLDDLDESQRQSGELHFPLTAAVPPGRLRAVAGGYEVSLTIGGRRHGPSSAIDLELPPGQYEVKVDAPEVSLSASHSLQIASDETVELPLPAAFEVQVAATPGNCQVSIDGRVVDVTPFRTRLAAGEHEFEFFWPTLGTTLSRRERITRADQRIFASPEGGRP